MRNTASAMCLKSWLALTYFRTDAAQIWASCAGFVQPVGQTGDSLLFRQFTRPDTGRLCCPAVTHSTGTGTGAGTFSDFVFHEMSHPLPHKYVGWNT